VIVKTPLSEVHGQVLEFYQLLFGTASQYL